ncbi:MAG TPA: hypothetical protein VIR15_04900 [Intrasporangium sp.]|uniref:hypothetical protein n=1 Tax=Intrasporangium sp. TaxID=1925024 RepID=UPI002F91FF2E
MSPARGVGAAAGIPWRPVAGLTVAGTGLLAVAAIWVTSPIAGTALTVGVPVLAAATAYLLDEAATEAVAATPTSLRVRSGSRLASAVGVLAIGAVGIAALALRSETSARLGIMLWLTGCALVAVAASATLRRRLAEPGDVVAGGLMALVLALAIAHPLDRWVDLFPTDAGQRWGGSLVVWCAIAAVAIVATLAATRDPLD